MQIPKFKVRSAKLAVALSLLAGICVWGQFNNLVAPSGTLTLKTNVLVTGGLTVGTSNLVGVLAGKQALDSTLTSLSARTITGTGNVVLATSPTFVTPVLGAASASSLTVGTTSITGVEGVGVACSDETTPLTTGTAKITFRMPYAFTVTAVRASLTTAQASGSIFTVDINEGAGSILSTKLTIDNTELTSTTAVTPPVISDSALADDAAITVDIDQIGNGSATGLKVWIIGHQ
jgi:hypothetical protein